MTKGVVASTGRSFHFKDRVGTRNGRLVFTKSVGINNHKQHIWEAVCDCGEVTTTSSPNHTKSCGCLQRETAAKTQLAKKLSDEERKNRYDANAIRQRLRRKENPLLAMQSRLSRLFRLALDGVSGVKTSPTLEALGYTASEFSLHIQRQFTGGMGWENMSEWQIDHIIPISTAETVSDVVALNQLSNLRPMWAKENNAKKAKRLSLL